MQSPLLFFFSVLSVFIVGIAVVESVPPAPTVEIAPGVHMPSVNLGLCNHSVWLANGGRGVDTALVYGDKAQEETGESVRDSALPRENVFVTTKVPCCPAKKWLKAAGGLPAMCAVLGHNTSAQIEHDMTMLDLEYVDLMLLHWPCDTFEETLEAYNAMEIALKAGTTKAIGISNFNASMVDRIVRAARIKPAVNQCGFSIAGHTDGTWGRDDATVAMCKKHGIAYEAYSPLGGWAKGGTGRVLNDPTVKFIAKVHNKTSAQVGLRWVVQQDILVVTESKNPDHLVGDLEIFDWSLTKEEMGQLAALR